MEPGNASVDELIDIVLNQYKHHPSVVGFGIDVEWYKSTDGPEGQPITDEEAKRWVAAVRKYNPDYRLFLKHWEKDWMPATEHDGIFFVDDSQQFESFDQMVQEFAEWGKALATPVGFQYGYPADRVWWQKFQDPPQEIGQALLDNVPNTKGLFWVDFTVIDIFPRPNEDDRRAISRICTPGCHASQSPPATARSVRDSSTLYHHPRLGFAVAT